MYIQNSFILLLFVILIFVLLVRFQERYLLVKHPLETGLWAFVVCALIEWVLPGHPQPTLGMRAIWSAIVGLGGGTFMTAFAGYYQRLVQRMIVVGGRRH